MNDGNEKLIETVRTLAENNGISPDLLESIINIQINRVEDSNTAFKEVSELLEKYFIQQEQQGDARC